MADPGDDIKSLEIPPDDSAAPPKDEKKLTDKAPPESHQQIQLDKNYDAAASKVTLQHHDTHAKSEFIPSPGIIQLLHQYNLLLSDVKGTGPKGRVLKGDILAHIGEIDKCKPEALARDIAKLSKLDLSNIKKAAPKPKEAPKSTQAETPVADTEPQTVFKFSISMQNVSKVQQKLKRKFTSFSVL
jgi:pyruvate/2-oxoglutarate dehydrogenase complex dihydrolipoamide acyltransferase (E2) component